LSRGVTAADLIADIYAAAIDEDGWPEFSTLIGKATGIEAVSVWVTENGLITDASVPEIYRPFAGAYKERFAKVDPWAGSLARNPLETIMLGSEHMREDELVKTEFYNDFARPGGMFRPMGVKMRLAPDVYATMGSENPFAKRLFEPADKRRVERLLPHVKRALQLRRRHRQSLPQPSTHAAALDALSFGVVICDIAARLVFANAAAEAFAREGAGITFGTRGKGVGAIVASEGLALNRLVHEAASGGAGGVLRLTGRDGSTALLVLVTPLPRPFNGHGRSGYAMVSLRSATERPAFTEAALAALFRLSPTQASIALELFNGKSPEEIAIARGVKISTLRTHLSDIYARTGAETQRDLIRLLGTLPPLRQLPG
jgi:DNA-binding CsgD family transcriptional regulator/PAS domain-containing protein